MLRYSLGQPQAAERIEQAVTKVLQSTACAPPTSILAGTRKVGTARDGRRVVAALINYEAC